MRVKASITISSDVLRAIDRHGREFKSHSAFLEAAARGFLERLARTKADRRDPEIINLNADRLNAQAEDVLAYPVKEKLDLLDKALDSARQNRDN